LVGFPSKSRNLQKETMIAKSVATMGTMVAVGAAWFRGNDLANRGSSSNERMYSFDFSAPSPAIIIRESEETRTST